MQRRTRAVSGLLIAALGLHVSGPLPFSTAELHEALALRVRPSVPVEVVASPAGDAIVRVGDKERTVALGDTRGPVAARRVALAVADLATDVDPLPQPSLRSAAPPPDTPSRARVSLLAGPSGGSNLDGVRFAAAIDVRLRLVSGFGVYGGVGYMPGPDAAVDGIAVGLRSAPLRLGLSWQAGALELRAGAVAQPYWLDGMMTTRTGMTAGGTVSALYSLDLAPSLDLVLAAGADAFANRDQFDVHGTAAIATNRIATWAALGIGWRPR